MAGSSGGGRIWWQGLLLGGWGPGRGCHWGWEPGHRQAALRKFPGHLSLTSADLSEAVGDGMTRNHSVDEGCKSLLRASVSPSAAGDNYPPPSSPHPRNSQPG